MREIEREAEPELLIDDQPIGYGQLPDGQYFLHEYAYDWRDDLLQKADDIPNYLLELRTVAAAFAGLKPEEFSTCWSRSTAQARGLVGTVTRPSVSLLSSCVFRMRRAVSKKKWERVNLAAEPRSAYLLSGPSRYEWEHSISQTDALRYSITFRTLRDG